MHYNPKKGSFPLLFHSMVILIHLNTKYLTVSTKTL